MSTSRPILGVVAEERGYDMEADVVIRAAENAKGRARYSQLQIDQFLDAHERFIRREPRGMRAVLRYLQAQGMSFVGRNLSECDLTGANLQGAQMAGADFGLATLFCADLSDTDARESNFFRADIRGVSLRNADLTGSNLDEADMRQAVLARADAEKGFKVVGRSGSVTPENGEITFSVDFTNCSMRSARLANAKLKGANFTGALLQGADLSGANLVGANFEGAVLIGALLERALIEPGALKRSIVEPTAAAIERCAELVERLQASGRWLASNGAEGGPAVLDDEDLRPLGNAFERQRLTAMSARRVCGIGVSFVGAHLQAANFDGADLREADFTGADLRGASLRGANLRHARFAEADIRALPLAQGRKRETDFTGADHAGDCFAASICD
jgi:uncharacterized protein YjbI with pentapeptide repeats